MIKAECKSFVKDSIVKVSERKSRHATFNNKAKAEFIKIQYDGCCKLNKIACDWVLVKSDVGTLAIELKGADIDHACVQIEETLNEISKQSDLPKKFSALIVCSRVPKVDTKVQRAKQRLAKQFRAPLHVKEDARNLDFEDLFWGE